LRFIHSAQAVRNEGKGMLTDHSNVEDAVSEWPLTRSIGGGGVRGRGRLWLLGVAVFMAVVFGGGTVLSYYVEAS
jgi:hypothetical protein